MSNIKEDVDALLEAFEQKGFDYLKQLVQEEHEKYAAYNEKDYWKKL